MRWLLSVFSRIGVTVVSQSTFCNDLLERFDYDDRSVALTRKPVDDLGDKIIEILEQPLGNVGFFCHYHPPTISIRRYCQSLFGANSCPGNRSWMAVSTMAILTKTSPLSRSSEGVAGSITGIVGPA